MKTIWQDLKYAVRVHFKNPKVALVIIATLGLGIGCLTAVFTVVNSVVLRPLFYKDPDRLLRLYESNPSQDLEYFSVSPLNWIDFRQNRSFEDLGAFVRQQDFNLGIGQNLQQVSANQISSNLFRVFGVTPLKGELFSAAYDKAGMENVAILGYQLWNAKFGRDQHIIGKTIYLDQKAYRVVAVMRADFRLPFNNGDLYVPLSLTPEQLQDRSDHFLRLIGRLKPGVSQQQAIDEMKNIASVLATRYPATNKNWTVTSTPLKDVVVPERFRNASWILLTAAFLVLIISCLNAANLLTVKTFGRYREISIRRAIGATNVRLLAQLLTESLLIAIVSGGLGTLLAVSGIDLLHSLEPQNIPRLQEIRLDRFAIGFAILASFFTVLFFGTFAARQSMKQELQEGLKEGSLASTIGRRSKNFRDLLVIIEAALSVVLLIGAGLLMKSFIHLQHVDLGFKPDSVISLRIKAPVEKYPDVDHIRNVQRMLLESVRALAGVEDAAITSLMPLGPGNSMTDFSTEGPPGPDMKKVFAAAFRIVSPAYFRTMGIRQIRGQSFSETRPGKSLIIDEYAARRFWPGQDPIGLRVFMSGFDGAYEIIGIVGQIKVLAVDEEPFPVLYLSNLEVPPGNSMYLIVRTSNTSSTYGERLRSIASEVDPNLVITSAIQFRRTVDQSLTQRRFNMVILSLFASVALILASVGLYSVISYSVSQRSHEIGIRIALGAQRRDVSRMIVKEGLILTVTGVTLGTILSLASTQILSTLLYFVSPTDAVIFQLCSVLFLVIGALAAYLPARQAAALDPIYTLRHE